MEFDKKTILAFALIGLILIIMQTEFYQKHFLPKPANKVPPITEKSDPTAELPTTAPPPQSTFERAQGGGFENLIGAGEPVTVENKFFRAEFSTQGATLRSLVFKEFFLVDKTTPVELFSKPEHSNLAALLPTRTDTLDTSTLLFTVNKKKISLSETHPVDSLQFAVSLDSHHQLKKTFYFYYDRYDFRLNLEIQNLNYLFDGYSYSLVWRSGLNSTEPDFEQDMSKSLAYAYQGGIEKFDAGSKFEPSDWDHPTDWVAVRTKYFAVAVIPTDAKGQGVRFHSEKINVGKKSPLKKYGFELQMPFGNQTRVANSFTVYVGPLSYDLLKVYNADLEDMLDLGGSIFRPFGKFILWCFIRLHEAIPNYGFVIVVFSILIKIVLYPLTKKSFQSMKEMQTLQPLMQEINEKYKNDPQKKQQEIMNLYKEHGVNPLGGCLPMLLQLPLLYALFQVFQSTIELRQAEFIWWIKDLSRPDTVALLPFTIPLYGNTLNILPLFMGVTMFIQQKMSMKDPKQKALVYIMPIFFTLLFNSFPSGLNLYYALFNVLSIAQEKLIPYHPKKPEELKLKKSPKKRIKHDYRGRYYK
jgi:YidC/Oxa1 family membrane protein insertase